ncbi:MAG: hypothetical protein LBT98_02320 [Puniceicoccales bacterium]|nr:hypothetical protein [Puniceicoccales bacterium]
MRSIPYAILCRCHALYPLALSERQLAVALSLEGYRVSLPLLREILANLRRKRLLELADGDGTGLYYRLRPAAEGEEFFFKGGDGE